jgi:hypothetical protein
MNLSAQVRKKTLVQEAGLGIKIGLPLYVPPLLYDSTLTDETILAYLDSFPPPSVRGYTLLFKDDTTRMAMMVNKTKGLTGLFVPNRKYIIWERWKNGNLKRFATYNSKHQLFGGYYEAYENNIPKIYFGDYKDGYKKGKWKYYNEEGQLIRIEYYTIQGKLMKTKEYNPPKDEVYIFQTSPKARKNTKGFKYVIK